MSSRTNPGNCRAAIKALLGICIAGSLVACAENNLSDLNQFVIDTKAKYKGQVEALPVILPYDSYSYDVSNSRNPFKPSVALIKSAAVTRSTNGLKPNQVRNKEELEKFPLTSLVMVGVMKNNGQKWAIIKAPDNGIYRVTKGNYMGEDHGKILRISESKIDLKELVTDGRGGWIEQKNKVDLAE